MLWLWVNVAQVDPPGPFGAECLFILHYDIVDHNGLYICVVEWVVVVVCCRQW